MAEFWCILVFGLVAWKAGWTHAPAADSFCEALRGDYQPEATEADVSRLRSGSLLPIPEPEPLGEPLLEAGTPRARKLLFFARCCSAKEDAPPDADAPREPG